MTFLYFSTAYVSSAVFLFILTFLFYYVPCFYVVTVFITFFLLLLLHSFYAFPLAYLRMETLL